MWEILSWTAVLFVIAIGLFALVFVGSAMVAGIVESTRKQDHDEPK